MGENSLHLRPRHKFVLLFSLFCPFLNGQSETEQLIEDLTALGAESVGDADLTETAGLLEGYRARPLDINRASLEDLNATYLLSPLQADRLIAYRDRMNGFISVYELQAVPGLDLETARRMAPFVTVNIGLDDISVPLKKLLLEADRQLFLRAARKIEAARGYSGDDPKYRGDPWRIYLKYRQRYGNQLSLGIVVEKDPGEPLLGGGHRRRGFDYNSVHFFLRNLSKRVRAVAIGDFSVSFGQGLILFTGFGFGKSSLTTTVARSSPTLSAYASVNEFNFMRGAGATLRFGDLELTFFGSRRRRTGNLSKDSLSISSLNESGYSRTQAEIDDRKAVAQTSYGASFKYRPGRRFHLAVNFLGERLSLPLLRREAAYNRYYFSGNSLQNVSVDYRYRLRNFSFFGEVAGAIKAGKAMLHGINIGLHRKADVAIVYRNYARDYQALSAQPFAESGGGRNEEGVYLGLEYRPGVKWRINAYHDRWRHAYLRYGIDGPSKGRESRLRVTFNLKRKLDAYTEIRSETKGYGNRDGEVNDLPSVIDRTKFQWRFHVGYKFRPRWEWRSRLDVGYTHDLVKGWQQGAMFFQDIHYRPLGSFSFSARLAVYTTDGYDVRFYEYENGLTYNAFVVPYYNLGGRSFLLLRYKGIRGLTLEARLAQSRYFDGTPFGSGWEATDKVHRTEVGMQAIWRW